MSSAWRRRADASPHRGSRAAVPAAARLRAAPACDARPARDPPARSGSCVPPLQTCREAYLESGPRAMQVRLHRSEWDAERIGHLLIGELLHVAKGERGAICRRKLCHRGHDLGDLFATDGGRLGALPRLVGTLGQLLDCRLVRVPTLDMIEARVRRDPVEPRTKG